MTPLGAMSRHELRAKAATMAPLSVHSDSGGNMEGYSRSGAALPVDDGAGSWLQPRRPAGESRDAVLPRNTALDAMTSHYRLLERGGDIGNGNDLAPGFELFNAARDAAL